MTQNVTTKVELDGAFFTRDPGKTLRGNVRDMLVALSDEMEKDVRDGITGQAGSMPFYTGWTANHVRGRAESVTGKGWGTWAVVSEDTRGTNRSQAIRTEAAASSIEGRFHPYRRVKSALYGARSLIRADLTRGLE